MRKGLGPGRVIEVEEEREGLRTIRIRPRFNCVNVLHRRNIININLLLQDRNESLPIHLDGKHARRKRQLTNNLMSLQKSLVSLRSAYGGFGVVGEEGEP